MMAKQGMARPDWTKLHPKNTAPAVPAIQGKAKTGKKKAKPVISGTDGPSLKVFHQGSNPLLDNDLAMDNLTNDIPQADLGDV